MRWMVLVVAVALSSCSDDRALTQRQFCELVRDRVEEQYPGILISRVDQRGFDWVRGTGDRGRMVVSEEYLYYTRDPDALDDLVDRLVSLIGTNERLAEVSTDRDRLRRRIMPLIKPPSFLSEAQTRSGGQPLLYGRHPAGLLVFYVLDNPTSLSYMTADSLGGLGMSFRQVNELALDNLARRTADDRFLVEHTDLGPMAVSDTRDGYDAARLISPTLSLSLSRVLDVPAAVVAVPRRDLLLAVPAALPELTERLRDRARAEHEAGPHAITTDLFLVDREGVRLFEPR